MTVKVTRWTQVKWSKEWYGRGRGQPSGGEQKCGHCDVRDREKTLYYFLKVHFPEKKKFYKIIFWGNFFSRWTQHALVDFFLMHIHEPHTTISCTSPRWILLRMKPDTSGVNTVLIWATFGSTADAPRPRPPCCRSAVHSSLLQTFIPDRTWWEVCLFQTNKEKVKSSTRTNELHHWIF